MSAGAVIRRAARPSDNFAQISNSTLADERLSWKATGLLAYLLSRPVGWGTTAHDLWRSRTHKGEGRDVVYAALRELEQYGYLVRRRVHQPDGTFTWEQEVYDTPVDNPGDTTSWNPGDGTSPSPEIQGPGYQESSTKKETKKKTPRSGGSTTSPPPVDNSPPQRALPRPERCPAHQHDAIAPPCGACKDARLTVEASERLPPRVVVQCEHGRPAAGCPWCPGGRLFELEVAS